MNSLTISLTHSFSFESLVWLESGKCGGGMKGEKFYRFSFASSKRMTSHSNGNDDDNTLCISRISSSIVDGKLSLLLCTRFCRCPCIHRWKKKSIFSIHLFFIIYKLSYLCFLWTSVAGISSKSFSSSSKMSAIWWEFIRKTFFSTQKFNSRWNQLKVWLIFLLMLG